MYYYKVITILCFFAIFNCYGNATYGLTFLSHTTNQDERTSLDLGGGEFLKLSGSSIIEFDLKLNDAPLAYGYVFRLVSAGVMTLDCISNVNTGKVQFLLIHNRNVLSNVEFDIPYQDRYTWKKVKIHLLKDRIDCFIDENVRTIPYSLDDIKKIDFFFGKNQHPVYHTTDVPPMTLRNICIKSENGNVLYNWKLLKYGDDEKVYDEIQNAVAKVDNGIWEIDRRIYWKKEASFSFNEKNPQIAYDSINARVFMLTRDSLFIYGLNEKKCTCVKTDCLYFSPMGGSNLIYNHDKDELLLYCYENKTISRFDIKQGKWSNINETRGLLPLMSQHNRFIRPKTNQLVLFGGYGNHTYNANLVTCSLDSADVWDVVDLSTCLPPRYLSALGYVGGNTFFVMGGHGSLSGRQEDSPMNYYEVFKITMGDTLDCEQMGVLKSQSGSTVFSNSMVVDTAKQTMYALAYSNEKYKSSIQLFSYNWENQQQILLADTLPFNFLDIESYCDLFLYKSSVLYSLILQEKAPGLYGVDIYSLEYPPLALSDVIQLRSEQKKNGIQQYLIFIGLFVVLLFVFVKIFLVNKSKKRVEQTEQTENKDETERFVSEKKMKSSIKLLGGFQIFDRDGCDVTDKFTPIVKQLFLLVLLNSTKNGKKITSQRLDETLWFGLDKVSASNNRNVNIRKLRRALENVDGVSIVHKSSYWSILIEDDVYFDYGRVEELLSKMKEDVIADKHTIKEILQIAQEGRMLPNITAEWVENYKTEFNDLMIETLSELIEKPEFENELNLRLQMANVILIYDSLDELAVRVKCKILSDLGQKGAAKQCYDKFYDEYYQVLGEKPNFSYKEIFVS